MVLNILGWMIATWLGFCGVILPFGKWVRGVYLHIQRFHKKQLQAHSVEVETDAHGGYRVVG